MTALKPPKYITTLGMVSNFPHIKHKYAYIRTHIIALLSANS